MGQLSFKMNEEYKSTTLQRAVALLDCFSQEQPEIGVREIARKVGLSSSTTGRLLLQLKELGILSQNPTNNNYSLGGRVLAWAGVYTSTFDVRNIAMPLMHELHQTTQETISLYILEGNERVCIERLESPQNVRIVARVGRRLPLYAGSAGKVFLAFLPPERRKAILDTTPLVPFTANTYVDRVALEKELEKIRWNGYSISSGEWVTDASGVAVPIFDHQGDIISAFTISGPTQRFTKKKIDQYVKEATRVAEHISGELGYRIHNSPSQKNLNPREVLHKRGV
jgi:IclR family transcriptional regulator, KDG regulon repressor